MQKEINVDDGQIVAEQLSYFRLRFQDAEEDEWRESWDSTDISQLDRLPLSVEISVQLYEKDRAGELQKGKEYSRTVPLPVRPIGREEAADEGSEDEDELDEDEREEDEERGEDPNGVF